MSKLIKFCYWVSIPVFMASLLYNYALLPEKVGILFDGLGMAAYSLTKGTFFYLVLGLFVSTNVLFYIYFQFGAKFEIDDNPLLVGSGHWALGLSSILNITFSVLVLFVSIFHGRDVDPNQYTWLVYIGPVLLVIWIFYAIYLKVASR